MSKKLKLALAEAPVPTPEEAGTRPKDPVIAAIKKALIALGLLEEEEEELPEDISLIDLGLDSLGIQELAMSLAEKFQVEISDAVVDLMITVGGLVKAILEARDT